MDQFITTIQERIKRGPDQKPVLVRIFNLCHKLVRATALRILPKELVDARVFSNVMIKKYGQYFSGDIINVSGWDDRDSRGKTYKEYFPNVKSYTISNASTATKGLGTAGNTEIEIDLNKPVQDNLKKKFDVVFNHTTLEHVLNFEQAFKNLCDMSRDAVVFVVPSLQQIHFSKGYGDYWRPTPLAIARLFYRNGFTPLVVTTNEQAFGAIYTFAVAVRDPKKYAGKIQPVAQFDMGGELYGSGLKYEDIPELLKSL